MAKLIVKIVLFVFLQATSISAQSPDPLADCSGPFDLVILLDSSVSLRDSDPSDRPLQTWMMMTNFSSAFVQSLPTDKNIQVAVVKYSSTSQVIRPLTPRENYPGSDITSLAFVGRNTNTAAALTDAKSILSGSSANRKIVLLLTDGLSTVNMDATFTVANQLKNISGMEIYSIGISNYIDSSGLSQIASTPITRYFIQLRGQSQVDSVRLTILNRVCLLPEPTPSPIPECKTVPNCKECVADPRICEVCNPGYYQEGWNCKECAAGIFDLTFLVDSSGSIRDKNPKDASGNVIYDNYEVILQFVVDMINSLPVSQNKTRVGMVYFSDDAKLNFQLNGLNYDRDLIVRAVLNTPYLGGYTNISGAMRLMRTEVNQPQNGDRPDVKNVCILLADGESNRDPDLTTPEATLNRQLGVTFFVIGVTSDIYQNELLSVASSPSYFFYSNDYVGIKNTVLNQLSNILCNGVNN